jgi:replicative DNA helicase
MVQSLDEVRRRARASSGRVPPHNLQAEQSLLGAMLLSRDAIAAAVETCGVDDFYKPAHGHIFEAITSLYGQGEPADPVTVADELTRAGLLDAVGGLPTLLSLQADTPATANAGRYGRIVEEHALLRRLIGVAGDIAEMGYEVPDDVASVLDRAETLMFEVAERRVTDTLRPLPDLLAESLDRLEALYARGEAITGVPTGYVDLDERLSGLQPSALLIVGARPAMGKALALDTPIPTPTGWTTMGTLSAGAEVLDDQGQPCRVTYATPVHHGRRCYRVHFDDGTSLVADADHQWFASEQEHRRRHPRVVTTEQMLDEGVRTGDGSRPNWYLPLTAPLDLPERELPVDPYVLGCWLGDGTSAGTEMAIGHGDIDHFRAELEHAGYTLSDRCDQRCATVPVPGSGRGRGYAGPGRVLTRELQEAGLMGGRPRHLPAAYLRASTKQRLALLQGLLDTDGCVINANGTVELCLSNEHLLRQARELICSLGHKPSAVRRRRVRLPDGGTTTAWRVAWTPLDPVFRLPRKAERLAATASTRAFGRMTRRAVTAIVPVPSVPVRCITVDAPSHLYLAGESLVPTHNTAFALGIAANAAMRSNTPVLVFSLEMSHSEITQRLLVSEARVDANRIRNGKLTESDWPKIHQAVARLAEAPIHIDDDPNLTVMELRAKARRHKSRHGGLGLIIVDYLQLMNGRNSAENRQVEVSEISRGLKILARELQVPVIALSQLSRNLEQRADRRPQLADLRESGSLEQDADVVMFLYRDEVYDKESPDRGTAEVIVAKHRNGPTGSMKLAFLDHYTRFENMARI